MAKQLPLEQPLDTARPDATAGGRRRTTIMIVVSLLALGFMAVMALGLRNTNTPRPQVSSPAPDFTLPLFSGGEFKLSGQRGKVVVINFWASWCIPCVDEAPELERSWQVYRDKGVVFIGVDYVDTEPKALEFLKKHGVSYPNGPDLGTRISQEYRIKGVPETFVIDQTGVVRWLKIGPTTQAELSSVIDPLLK